MKKKLNYVVRSVFTIALLIFCLNSLNLNLYAEIRYVKELWKNGGNGVWWNPFDRGHDYVNVLKLIYVENNVTIHKIKVECYGNGVNICPEDKVLGITNPPSWVPYEEYVDESFHTMLNYVYSEAEQGNYSGEQSFNQIINSNMIYRNVSWVGDSSDVHIIMKIFNVNY